METAQPPSRKLRKRSKSVSAKEEAPAATTEVAPDLNGDSDAKPNKGEEPESHVPALKEDKPKSEEENIKHVTQGRKRKASEMKDDADVETNIREIGDNKEKKEVTEPVHNAEEDKEKADKEDEKFEKSEEKEEPQEVPGDSKEIRLPPKQTLGKGKRARIPNKRYSDILLSPKAIHSDTESKSKKASLENGLVSESTVEKENISSESDSKFDMTGSQAISNIKRPSQASPASASKKPKVVVDLSNPNYLKPFKYGWKRELVYRASAMSDTSAKRNGDIYYYTPGGKKVRSMREVSENLKNKELSLDDFTFFKEPLGLDDPEKEIIRDAKFKSANVSALPRKSTPKAKAPKILSPKLSTSSPAVSPAIEASETETPKVKNSRLSSFKIKLSGSRGQSKQSKQEKKIKDEDMDVGTYPPNWQSPKKATKWTGNANEMDNKPCRPCSIRCQGVVGLIPTLQCRVCLCLYHNECVGLAPHSVIQGYVCKNCQLDQDSSTSTTTSTVAPPPLTPVNSLKVGAPHSTGLPKLHRIPRSGESATSSKPTELPKLTPRPGIASKFSKTSEQQSHVENKSLVGGVTTWFPPSSTIQVGNNQFKLPRIGPVQVPRPQFVEYLGDKKYLIIPKHSVLSVSPTIAATAATRVEENVSTPAPDDSGLNGGPSAPDSASLGPEITTTKTDPDSSSNTFPSPATLCTSMAKDDGLTGRSADESTEGNEADTPKGKKATRASNIVAQSSKSEEGRYMDNYLQNLAYGYNTLLYVFQYLKVQDLLRAGCVCHMWRDIASHPILWRTVRMKNSQVHSFDGLADTLQKHGTVHLDLRKMLLPSSGDELWQSFSQAIKKVDSLRKIEFCRCPASVVEQLPSTNPKLEVINAVTIRCESMSLAPFSALKNLQELRLKSTAGLTLTSDLSALKELTQLRHLSLTSIKDLNKQNIEVIADLVNLESLDLGECTDFPKTFGPDILTKLTKLEKLRLEKGQGSCFTFEILEAVKDMPHLEQLELVNFDIKGGFDKALGACINIKKLLIIPTYISQSATTNHMVLGGVLRLRSTLSHFVWGVTLELLRVTELFVDQCEEPEKKDKRDKKAVSNGDSIPVLKPVPLLTDGKTEIPPAHEPPQVEILPLPNLQKLLLQSLPTTRVKILKIPFHATWRQSITDTVN